MGYACVGGSLGLPGISQLLVQEPFSCFDAGQGDNVRTAGPKPIEDLLQLGQPTAWASHIHVGP
jgi:hypothetical protein